MILVRNGRVIDPKTKRDEAVDLVIKDGKIHRIGKYHGGEDYEQVIDASGKIVAPGLIDVHAHFRDPGSTYKETVETGAAAAKRGGYTTIVCMANTKPPIDSPEAIHSTREKGKRTGIRILQAACVTKGMKGQELVDMAGKSCTKNQGHATGNAAKDSAMVVCLCLHMPIRIIKKSIIIF